MKVSVKSPDFRQFIIKLEDLADDKLEDVRLEIKDSADQIVKMAKDASPVNESRLRGSISREEITPFQYEIVAQTKYAAFMEFGTRTLVNIPPGAEEIARQAQGIKGGTIQEMQKNIERWVKLKGLASGKDIKRVTFLIMRKILKVGVKPQPFFFPAIQRQTPILAKRLTKIIND